MLHKALADTEILVLPFSALAQSCRSYEEYATRMAVSTSAALPLAALGLVGPAKKSSA